MDECPRHICFENQLKHIIKKYPNSQKSIEKDIRLSLEKFSGDTIPGFALLVKKARIALKEYGIGKSNGLRLIYFVNKNTNKIIMVSIYSKAEYHKESDELRIIKNNLKLIIDDLSIKEKAQ